MKPNSANMRELVLSVFDPQGIRCGGGGDALTRCVSRNDDGRTCRRMGWQTSSDGLTTCTLETWVPDHIPQTMEADEYGTMVRSCPHRRPGWRPGPRVRTAPRPDAAPDAELRAWCETLIHRLAKGDHEHAVAARGVAFDDWAGLDTNEQRIEAQSALYGFIAACARNRT